MANRSADFNYKVALASGLKSLQGGRLRQAEEQFRYLVQHFPSAEGGYRGLAKVLVEQQDRAGALKVMLDGGAALAKSGQRDNAITLFKEAIALDPNDYTAHRRLAASYTAAGNTEEAAHEYLRYVRIAVEASDQERAKNELAYALQKLPGNGELIEAAKGLGAPIPRPAAPRAQAGDRDSLMASAFGTAPVSTSQARWTAPAAAAPTANGNPSWEPAAPAAEPSAADQAWGATSAPEIEPIAADADALTVEATAARYLAKGDPRGGQAALEAAKRYIADGRVDAASDLLLQLIGANINRHDAQRLLVDVTRTLGKRDVAKAKAQLLVQALKLDGRNELAAEVEQLVQAF